MAGRGHEHDLRVGRIHGDTVDGLRFLETQVMPGFAAVCCAPDAVTDGRALTVIGLAGPAVYDVWIRRRNADGAYRLVLITVELRVPVIASIRRFPEPTSRKPDVHNHGIFFRALNIIEPPHHHCRTDGAELEASQHRIVRFIRLRRSCLCRGGGLGSCHDGEKEMSKAGANTQETTAGLA